MHLHLAARAGRRKRRLLKKAGNLTVEELNWLMARHATRAA